MKATSREKLMELLEKKFPNMWTKEGELFGNHKENTIWTGEGSYLKDKEGMEWEIFDYFSMSETYQFGVHIELVEFLNKHGYYTECNDPGTYFITPQ